ncbi:MAG: hypothetical protein PHS60_07370 [Zavarzinia sp.]|nr:hypothetical protein [Zavarzinia sp.]
MSSPISLDGIWRERRALVAVVEQFLVDGLDSGSPSAAGGFATGALLLDATGDLPALSGSASPEAWMRAYRNACRYSCHMEFSHVVDAGMAGVCSQFTRLNLRDDRLLRQECAGHFRFRDGLITGAVIHASRPVEIG